MGRGRWRKGLILILTVVFVVFTDALPQASHGALPGLRLCGGRGRPRTRTLSPTGLPAVATRSTSWSWLTESSTGKLSKLTKLVMAVFFYFSTSLSLTFMNKALFNRFSFPLLVTLYQQIATWVLLWSFGVLGLHFNRLSFVPPPEFDARIGVDILPLTALYVAMLSSTNYCLRHVDISFYQILRSLVIPFNIVTSYLCLGFVPRPRTVGCCSVVMCGFVIGSMSELNFTYQGFTAGCLASLFMAMYSTYVKKVLPCVNGSTWRLMNYTTVLSVLFLAPLAVFSGEARTVRDSPMLASSVFWVMMTQAAFLGFLINLAYFVLIKHGSPLTTHIANCSKSALQTMLGVLIFGNRVTALNLLGIVLTLIGSALYSMDRFLAMESAKVEAAAPQPPPHPPSTPTWRPTKQASDKLHGAPDVKRRLF